MDVAKVIRKVVPPHSGENSASAQKSSLSRLQATKNHVCTMRGTTRGQGSATVDGSKSSKGRPPKPKLCPKPQALVERMRQEKLAQKIERERVKDSTSDCIDNEVADDSGDEKSGPSVEMRIKGVNLKLEDSVFEEKASDVVTKSSGTTSDVTITSLPTSQASSHDTEEAKPDQDHSKEVSKSVSNTSTSDQKDSKSNGHKKSHQERSSPTSPLSSTDFIGTNKPPARLHMRAVTRHKSESCSPRDSSSKSSTLPHLSKQSSDITFDRGKGKAKKFTSSVQVSGHTKEGIDEDSAESDDNDDDDAFCEEGESFRTRVARFAREKFHRALSLGSPHQHQQQQQSSALSTGGWVDRGESFFSYMGVPLCGEVHFL